MKATILNNGVLVNIKGYTKALKDYSELLNLIRSDVSEEFYKIINSEKGRNFDIEIEISVKKHIPEFHK
jgi:hypothetical protein